MVISMPDRVRQLPDIKLPYYPTVPLAGLRTTVMRATNTE